MLCFLCKVESVVGKSSKMREAVLYYSRRNTLFKRNMIPHRCISCHIIYNSRKNIKEKISTGCLNVV